MEDNRCWLSAVINEVCDIVGSDLCPYCFTVRACSSAVMSVLFPCNIAVEGVHPNIIVEWICTQELFIVQYKTRDHTGETY